MAVNGTAILLEVEGQVVGSQQGVTFNETTEAVDVSNNEHRQRRVIPGMYGSTIALDALYVPADAGYLALQQAMRGHAMVDVTRIVNGYPQYGARALITALSARATDQAAALMSAALTLDGGWYVTVACSLGIYNVQQYGAIGNGVVDDTAAIQDAINAANAAGGGTVYFPPGTYKATNITLAGMANITLMGAGAASILDNSGNNTRVFEIKTSSNHIAIESLTFRGDFGIQTTDLPLQAGIEVKHSEFVSIRNCHFEKLCGDAITVGWTTHHVDIGNNSMDGGLGFVGMIGSTVDGYAEYIDVHDNTIRDTITAPRPPAGGINNPGSDDLIDGWGMKHVSIRGNTFNMQGTIATATKSNHAILLLAVEAEGQVVEDVAIVGNVIDGCISDDALYTSKAIELDASQWYTGYTGMTNVSVVGNTIKNCSTAIAVFRPANSMVVSGNAIYDCKNGIKVTLGDYCTVQGNTIDKASLGGIYLQGNGLVCVGNILKDLAASGQGIVCVGDDSIVANNLVHLGGAGCYGFSVEGNRNQIMFNTASHCLGYGIAMQGDYIHCIGNHYHDNGTDFADWGTNTITTLDE